jgi:hypothetical protein
VRVPCVGVQCGCLMMLCSAFRSDTSVSSLAQRLKKLETAQKHAQVMQHGIWKDWQEEKLSDRVLSAGKRATSKGFKKLVDSIRH